MSVEEIMKEMERDIHGDIYGDIYGHEYWAEEIFRLREEVKRLRDNSWDRNPDRSGGQFTQEEINRENW
jgi:hypothetical protein